MGHHIAVSETPDPADRAAIAAGLDAFNDARVGAEPIRPLAVLVRDDAGRVARAYSGGRENGGRGGEGRGTGPGPKGIFVST